MSDNEFGKGDAFLAGAVLTGLLTFVLTMTLGVEKWHKRTCHEQFNQAATATDSLTVIRDDSFCDVVLDR